MTEAELIPDICGACGYHRCTHLNGICLGKKTKTPDGSDISAQLRFKAWSGTPSKVYIDQAKQDLTDVICGWCGDHERAHRQGRTPACNGFIAWGVTTFSNPSLSMYVLRAKKDYPEEFGLVTPPATPGGKANSFSSKAKRICECGAWSMGVQDRSYGHSSWCPAASATLPKDLLK